MCENEWKMVRELHRRNSFQDWPYDNSESLCSSKKLAEAGFFHIPTDAVQDLVKCFVCLQELEGWEAEDIPWEEHKVHSPKCPFVKLNKVEADITVEELMKIQIQRQRAIIKKVCSDKLNKFDEEAAKIGELLRNM